MTKKIRTVALISYFFIFLKGSMIKMPLGSILFLSIFDLTTLKWTIYGIIGFILEITNLNMKPNRITYFLSLLSFILLLIPIINRLLMFSWDWFNYPLFYIPLSIFLICHFVAIIFEFKLLKKIV